MEEVLEKGHDGRARGEGAGSHTRAKLGGEVNYNDGDRPERGWKANSNGGRM